MKEMWNQRYTSIEYSYGITPNEYFKEKLSYVPKGKILLPADGEGRNGVFAALNGWEVHSCDFSEQGKIKAKKLADINNVQIEYQVGDFSELSYTDNFDLLALIYAHFPADVKIDLFKKAGSYLKRGAYVIVEVFSKNNLKYREKNPSIGGPTDLGVLFNTSEIEQALTNFTIIELEEKVVWLNEGKGHLGEGSVIRCFAQKK